VLAGHPGKVERGVGVKKGVLAEARSHQNETKNGATPLLILGNGHGEKEKIEARKRRLFRNRQEPLSGGGRMKHKNRGEEEEGGNLRRRKDGCVILARRIIKQDDWRDLDRASGNAAGRPLYTV